MSLYVFIFTPMTHFAPQKWQRLSLLPRGCATTGSNSSIFGLATWHPTCITSGQIRCGTREGPTGDKVKDYTLNLARPNATTLDVCRRMADAATARAHGFGADQRKPRGGRGGRVKILHPTADGSLRVVGTLSPTGRAPTERAQRVTRERHSPCHHCKAPATSFAWGFGVCAAHVHGGPKDE